MAAKSWPRSVITISAAVLLLAALTGGQTVSVTTWHNDNLRTGQNLNETSLVPSNLPGNFGQLCSYNVSGQVYSQPLVIANVTINGTNWPSVAFVVTETDMLYAFSGAAPSAGPCTLIGSPLSLVPSGQYPTDCYFLGKGTGGSCNNTIAPYVGILGTPVIGPLIPNQPNPKWPLYVVTETQDTNPVGHNQPQNWYHYLHAVDIQTLTEIVTPIRISPPGSTTQSTWSHRRG